MASIAVLFRNAHRAVDREVLAALAANGFPEIQPGHGIVLRNLGDDGARPHELAARAGVSRQAITKVLVDLEQLRLIHRERDPADGRGVVVRYTERGLAGLAVARRTMQELEEEFARRVGERPWDTVRDVLEGLFPE